MFIVPQIWGWFFQFGACIIFLAFQFKFIDVDKQAEIFKSQKMNHKHSEFSLVYTVIFALSGCIFYSWKTKTNNDWEGRGLGCSVFFCIFKIFEILFLCQMELCHMWETLSWSFVSTGISFSIKVQSWSLGYDSLC